MRREQSRIRAHARLHNDASVTPHQSEVASTGSVPIEPHLDDALLELEERDREAVIMRFFGNRTLRDVGAALNTTEDAARKRVSRALDRLSVLLRRRGATTVTSASLGASLTQTTEAAPIDLLPNIASSVHGAALLADATAATLFWSKVKLATCILAVAAIPAAWQWVSNRQLQRELVALQQTPLERSLLPAPEVSWLPEVERPGALSLSLAESPNQLLAMLAGVWAVESRRGVDSLLTLLRDQLHLDESQTASVTLALREAQIKRAELVQAIAQGDAQFDNIMHFLRAEDAALDEIRSNLSPAQRTRLSDLRTQQKAQRAENLARWRMADLATQFSLNPGQEVRVLDVLMEHARAYDSHEAHSFADFNELLSWLNARQLNEENRLRDVLTKEQFKHYLAQPEPGRSAMDVLRRGERDHTP